MARIFGLETEFGLTCLAGSSRRLNTDQAARVLFDPITSRFNATNTFLCNGSRLYLDVGSHPEYATAECSDLIELITHDRAGELIMADLAMAGNAKLRADGIDAKLVLYKNNTDSHGNSYGCHENYLIRRLDDFSGLTEAVLPFLVTRQLLCGAGKIIRDQSGRTRFAVSQRAQHMLDDISSASTRSRPMINTRDEPHADPRRFRRMHVVVGDSNLAEASALLKIGSMDLVLQTLEQSGTAVFDEWKLADPIAAINTVAIDPSGRQLIELADGRKVNALDIQQAYFEKAAELDIEIDHIYDRVYQLWSTTLEALAADQLQLLARDIEWVIKLQFMDRYASKHGIDLDHPRIAQLDLVFHDICGQGILRLLEKQNLINRFTTDAAVDNAMTDPPHTTRAKLRGEFVSIAQNLQRDYAVDWALVQCKDLPDGTVLCPDPFSYADERVERLLERMRTEP